MTPRCQAWPFTVEDGIEDGQAGHSGDIADGVVDLHVHLIERFLYPEEMLAAGLHETANELMYVIAGRSSPTQDER